MYLAQHEETGYWVMMRDCTSYLRVHDPADCEGRGCGIHNRPSDHPLKDAPMYWRTDRGILERICVHGVGHPDHDSAEYLTSIGKSYENIHGCDGCCFGGTY